MSGALAAENANLVDRLRELGESDEQIKQMRVEVAICGRSANGARPNSASQVEHLRQLSGALAAENANLVDRLRELGESDEQIKQMRVEYEKEVAK